MNKLYAVIWSLVIIFATMLVIYVYIALVPYFKIVGYIALGVLVILVLCGLYFVVAFTLSKTSIMWSNRIIAINQRQLLTHGDMAVWLRKDGTYIHLSAELERARVVSSTLIDTPDELPAIEGPDKWKYPHNLTEEEREKEVIAACNNGSSERAIADVLKISRDKVRKIKKKYGLLEA